MMKIKDIQSIKTGKTRTDGRYPLRIGCTVKFLDEPQVSQPMILEYVKDNHGDPKGGYLRTSSVTGIDDRDNVIIIHTLNSIYHLEK